MTFPPRVTIGVGAIAAAGAAFTKSVPQDQPSPASQPNPFQDDYHLGGSQSGHYHRDMRLRETTLADLDLLLKWVPSKQAMVMWSGPTFNWPLTRHQLEAYLKNDRRQYWTGLHPSSKDPVGHASVLADEKTRTMRLGLILLDPVVRGNGLGRELVTAAVRAGFESSSLPVMTLGVYSHNAPARHMYENLGFRETGQVRSIEVEGQQWHALEMQLDRHDLIESTPHPGNQELS